MRLLQKIKINRGATPIGKFPFKLMPLLSVIVLFGLLSSVVCPLTVNLVKELLDTKGSDYHQDYSRMICNNRSNEENIKFLTDSAERLITKLRHGIDLRRQKNQNDRVEDSSSKADFPSSSTKIPPNVEPVLRPSILQRKIFLRRNALLSHQYKDRYPDTTVISADLHGLVSNFAIDIALDLIKIVEKEWEKIHKMIRFQ